jgi:hypothetical protein
VKFLNQPGEHHHSGNKKKTADNPSGKNEIAAGKKAHELHGQRVERKKDYIGKHIIRSHIITISGNIDEPDGIPSIVKIDEIPIMVNRIVRRIYPGKRLIGKDVQPMQGNQGEDVDNHKPDAGKEDIVKDLFFHLGWGMNWVSGESGPHFVSI